MAFEILPTLSKKEKSLEGKIMAKSPKKTSPPAAATPSRAEVGLPSVMVDLIAKVVDERVRKKRGRE
jgi:hypothetical protein